ncbi:MAG: hypothetical protein AB8G96_13695 [Phycisphaerales bacterium]
MRLFKRLFIVFLILLVLLIVLVAIAPMLVARGVGQGAVVSRLDAAVTGDASVDAIRPSWFGSQEIDGLVLTSADGQTRIEADVAVDHGLFGLLFSRPAVLAVSMGGKAVGSVDEQGRTSFGDLFPPADPAKSSEPKEPGPDGPGTFTLPTGLDLTLTGLRAELSLPVDGAQEILTISQLAGSVQLEAGQPVRVDLDSPTNFAGRDGSIAIDAVIRDVFGADAIVRPLDASIESATVALAGVPVPAGPAPAMIESLTIDASGSLATQLNVEFESLARIGDATESSAFQANAVIDTLVRDGAIDVGGATYEITADGRGMPTAIAQPFLEGRGVVLARDLGPTLEVDVKLSSQPGQPVTVKARGSALSLDIGGTMRDARLIDITRATLSATAHPELLAHYAPSVELAAPAPMTVTVDPFTLDLDGLAEGVLPPAVQATIDAPQPLRLTMLAAAEGETAADADADAANAEPAAPTIINLAGLKIRAALAPARTAQAGGGVVSADVAPNFDVALSASRATVSHAALTLPLSIDRLEASGRGDLDFAAPLNAAVRGSLSSSAGTVAELDLSAIATLPPSNADAGAAGDAPAAAPEINDLKLVLSRIAPAALESTLGLDAGTMSDWTGGGGDVTVTGPVAWPGGTRPASSAEGVELPPVQLEAAFPGLAGQVNVGFDGEAVHASIPGALRLRPPAATINRILAPKPAEDGTPPSAQAVAAALTVRGTPSGVLQLDRAVVPLGLFGDENVAEAGQAVRLNARLRTDALSLVRGSQAVELPAHDTRINAESLDVLRLVIAPPASAGAGAGAGSGPGAGSGAPKAPAAPGSLNAELTVRGLIAGGELAPGAARLDGTATINQLPTGLIGAFVPSGGLLSAAIGPTVQATVTADGFSRDAGTVALDARADYGSVAATIRGDKGAFVVDAEQPVTATLDVHPALQTQILSRIQPIFSGVSTSDGPLSLVVGPARFDPEAGVSTAFADFNLTSGRVTFEQGFEFLSVLSFFDRSAGGDKIQAMIPPIKGRLQSGVVSTDGTTIEFTKGAALSFKPGSSYDLASGNIDMQAEFPLKFLGSVFREARGITDDIKVPLLAKGPASTTKLAVDPSFDVAGALVDAGVRGLIEKEIGDKLPGVGDAIGDLLRGLGGDKKKDGE